MANGDLDKGIGWITFAAVMLMIGGMSSILDGLWALDKKDQPIDALLFDDNIAGWGWFYVILGVVLIAAGFALFNQAQWARWLGIGVAAFSGMLHMTWLYAYPISSLIAMLLAVLVIYALTVYGDKDFA